MFKDTAVSPTSFRPIAHSPSLTRDMMLNFHRLIGTATRGFAVMVLAAATSASAADATDTVQAAERTAYEYMLQAQVLVSCRAMPPEEDIAQLEASGGALGRATFEQLWMQFDAVDPTQHLENGKKADETLQRLIVDADQKAEQLFREKGCAGLENELKAQR